MIRQTLKLNPFDSAPSIFWAILSKIPLIGVWSKTLLKKTREEEMCVQFGKILKEIQLRDRSFFDVSPLLVAKWEESYRSRQGKALFAMKRLSSVNGCRHENDMEYESVEISVKFVAGHGLSGKIVIVSKGDGRFVMKGIGDALTGFVMSPVNASETMDNLFAKEGFVEVERMCRKCTSSNPYVEGVLLVPLGFLKMLSNVDLDDLTASERALVESSLLSKGRGHSGIRKVGL